jgi:F-type H+-transporting ATPase subunit b
LAAEGAKESPVSSASGTVFKWINFSIIAFGLWYLFGRALRSRFHDRIREIAGAINDAAKAKQDAAKKLREAEGKLERLDLEVGVLREGAERDASSEAERIRAAAKDEAARIERAAEMEILAAERAVRMELKALAARLGVERAEAELRGKMTTEMQALIFQAFVDNLGRGVN